MSFQVHCKSLISHRDCKSISRCSGARVAIELRFQIRVAGCPDGQTPESDGPSRATFYDANQFEQTRTLAWIPEWRIKL